MKRKHRPVCGVIQSIYYLYQAADAEEKYLGVPAYHAELADARCWWRMRIEMSLTYRCPSLLALRELWHSRPFMQAYFNDDVTDISHGGN